MNELDELTTIVVRNGTISRHKRHWPLRIDLVGFCGGHLHERTWQASDRGEPRIRLGSVAVQQVEIDVSARGFQLCGVGGVQGGLGVAVAQGEKEAVENRASRDGDEIEAYEGFGPIS